MADRDCIFCKLASKEIPTRFILESNSFFAIEDIKPEVKGHLLVIPKRHFVTLLDIPDSLGTELLSFMKKVSSHILDTKSGNGFNVVMNNLEVAGQVIRHAHIHFIPRNEGDGIRLVKRG